MGALDGRVAIITGGGRGLGREHARLFAAEGAKVLVNDLGGAGDGSGADASAAQQVVDEIVASGGAAVVNTDSVAYLAAADCPFTGQAFSVYGNGVGIYQGWSISEDVDTHDVTTVDELATAMDKLPRRVKVRNQNQMLFGEEQ